MNHGIIRIITITLLLLLLLIIIIIIIIRRARGVVRQPLRMGRRLIISRIIINDDNCY